MITAELLKADLEFTTDRVKELIDTIWSLEKVPRKWKRGLIIKIPKKGNLRECKNWWGVTLLPVVSKILGRIALMRDDVKTFSGYMKARLGGERFA